MWQALGPQDGLYTLVERQHEKESATVIGSVCEVIFAGETSRVALDAMVSSAVRIVSLTITENGYCINPATKQLDVTHPSIVHDLAHPEVPRSAIGIIVEAYRRRMAAGLPAVTALTCDNIQHNGAVLRSAVLALAQCRDPRLAAWIEASRWSNKNIDAWVDAYYVKRQNLKPADGRKIAGSEGNYEFPSLASLIPRQQSLINVIFEAGDLPSRLDAREEFDLRFDDAVGKGH